MAASRMAVKLSVSVVVEPETSYCTIIRLLSALLFGKSNTDGHWCSILLILLSFMDSSGLLNWTIF